MAAKRFFIFKVSIFFLVRVYIFRHQLSDYIMIM